MSQEWPHYTDQAVRKVARAYKLPPWIIEGRLEPEEDELYREAELLDLEAELRTAIPQTHTPGDPSGFEMETVTEVLEYQRGGALS